MGSYDPSRDHGLDFTSQVPSFADGTDSPSAYLERCIDVIRQKDPDVQAFVTTNVDAARAAADASSTRWRAGEPCSTIDGMPIGIKDLLETRDMPTEYGSPAYRGNFPKRDTAAVWALREAGAIIIGKTVTAELGGSHPGPTTNPYDATRTPGGSSSGSAAAVAAGMVPAAIGTQVGGSIIRPAGYCGNIALKPSQGAINRGERQATSMSTHGVHANSIDDMWHVAVEIAKRVGGDRGFRGLTGPDHAPAATRPKRIAVLETEGFSELDDVTRATFARMVEQIASLGVDVVTRREHPLVETMEQSVRDARRFGGRITAWENQWAQRGLIEQFPDETSERLKRIVQMASEMTPSDYRDVLRERDVAQAAHASLAGFVDAMLTLSCPGPAHVWQGDVPGEPLAPRPTGDAVFNLPSSVLFAPAVTVPLLAVGGLPVGIQFMGQVNEDARMTAIARWAMDNLSPVTS